MNPLGSTGAAAEPSSAVVLEARLRVAFRERWEAAPTLSVRAPGRVNLLGEHTDYNEGFVLPMAIDRSIGLLLRPRDDRRVVLRSLDFHEERTFDLDALEHEKGGWIEYVKGTAWALGEAGLRLRGFDGVLAGDVPMGAGLSSSAALELATARAFCSASNLEWDPMRVGRAAQRAENRWVGVQCGIMDQLIVACGLDGHALLVDCRDLTVSPRQLPKDAVVVVLDTGTRRDLSDSAYNERRAGCEQAARLLDLRSLRDLSAGDLAGSAPRLPVALLPLVRHVVTENARTMEAAEALRRGDAVGLGSLMAQSHRSLRDDFRVSCHALDAMALSAAEAPGCFGARMTGAGFGGCVVALVRESDQLAFTLEATRAYQARTGVAANAHVCLPSGGASVQTLG